MANFHHFSSWPVVLSLRLSGLAGTAPLTSWADSTLTASFACEFAMATAALRGFHVSLTHGFCDVDIDYKNMRTALMDIGMACEVK
eukprot:SAG31_NODE_10608_length_1118_cov_1.019627_2_plen_86_part_00